MSDDLSYEKVQTLVNQQVKPLLLVGSSPTIGTKSKSLELQRFKALFPCISTVCGHSIVKGFLHCVKAILQSNPQNVIRFVI
jgi:hypothetical protein